MGASGRLWSMSKIEALRGRTRKKVKRGVLLARQDKATQSTSNKQKKLQWERNSACFPDKYKVTAMVPHHIPSVASSIKTSDQMLNLLFQLMV